LLPHGTFIVFVLQDTMTDSKKSTVTPITENNSRLTNVVAELTVWKHLIVSMIDDEKVSEKGIRCTYCQKKAFDSETGKQVIKMKRCATCKVVSYCNKVCQQLDWPTHREKFCSSDKTVLDFRKFTRSFEHIVCDLRIAPALIKKLTVFYSEIAQVSTNDNVNVQTVLRIDCDNLWRDYNNNRDRLVFCLPRLLANNIVTSDLILTRAMAPAFWDICEKTQGEFRPGTIVFTRKIPHADRKGTWTMGKTLHFDIGLLAASTTSSHSTTSTSTNSQPATNPHKVSSTTSTSGSDNNATARTIVSKPIITAANNRWTLFNSDLTKILSGAMNMLIEQSVQLCYENNTSLMDMVHTMRVCRAWYHALQADIQDFGARAAAVGLKVEDLLALSDDDEGMKEMNE
jgi:hypothetical protein